MLAFYPLVHVQIFCLIPSDSQTAFFPTINQTLRRFFTLKIVDHQRRVCPAGYPLLRALRSQFKTIMRSEDLQADPE